MSEIINTGATTLKKIMIDKHISVKDLSNKLQNNGYNISARVLSNKLYRDTFTLNEYILIANALDCNVKTISKDLNTEYTVDCNIDLEKNKFNNKKEKMKKIADSKNK